MKAIYFQSFCKDKAIESQLQTEYNQYRSDLHSEWYVSKESDNYIELMLKRIWMIQKSMKKSKWCSRDKKLQAFAKLENKKLYMF
jgi:hypothetical protein